MSMHIYSFKLRGPGLASRVVLPCPAPSRAHARAWATPSRRKAEEKRGKMQKTCKAKTWPRSCWVRRRRAAPEAAKVSHTLWEEPYRVVHHHR